MKEIHLTGKHGVGKSAIVSDEDFEFLTQWEWRICTSKLPYARRDVYIGKLNGKNNYHVTYMHRVVLERSGFDLTGKVGDHINGNSLDNRRENLRIATATENTRNQRPSKTSTGFKGVVFHKRDKKFQASIRAGEGKIHLGYFSTAEAAHQAYRTASARLHGAFSCTEISR